ncbi:hypothetical protein [Microseira sp. BLCC-F43]|uniref:hypothetical protein n=1 Tax=Microseira sp. BLCC-F43 TaxID=3153602 RepID=UPI0035BB24DD
MIPQETGFLRKIVDREPEIPARNPVSFLVVGKSWDLCHPQELGHAKKLPVWQLLSD